MGRIRRTRHSTQRGLTLLEVLITIALIAVGFVGITAGIAQAERSATLGQDQSQLEVAMRQLADFVRDSNPSKGLPYSQCATVTTPVSSSAAGSSTYTPQLPAKPITGVTQWGITAIYESPASGGTLNGAPNAAWQPCPGGATADYGVQEIKLTVFSGNNSLSRIVWKSFAWCYQGAAAC